MRGDFDAAGKHYAEALRASPEFARAQLGAAEVRFQTARGRCAANAINATGVEEAIKGYQGALQARIQPALSDIPTKTAYALGRAYLCLSEAGAADRLADAERELRQVVAEYERGNERVRELAGEAHAHLGLLSLPFTDDPNPEGQYRRAAEEYYQAIALTRRQELHAAYYRMLGFIYGRLKEYDEADKAYAEAIRLASVRAPERAAEYERYRWELQQERVGAAGSPPASTPVGE